MSMKNRVNAVPFGIYKGFRQDPSWFKRGRSTRNCSCGKKGCPAACIACRYNFFFEILVSNILLKILSIHETLQRVDIEECDPQKRWAGEEVA
ncbi:hypothetical protein ES319_A05G396800v1 [Gossypium barbadense]|uniref:Uncharacterized protein n=2 Tax=Gossypium TaxID=3633 RepID=A0A5J5VZ40_GOSBA|nr:hypothetical protein ES319_A05G396800v1 [Gossypium barbadense]TYH20348.1 hypothetical protein ES288_A05G423400v1 [Gossypium darwinii]